MVWPLILVSWSISSQCKERGDKARLQFVGVISTPPREQTDPAYFFSHVSQRAAADSSQWAGPAGGGRGLTQDGPIGRLSDIDCTN